MNVHPGNRSGGVPPVHVAAQSVWALVWRSLNVPAQMGWSPHSSRDYAALEPSCTWAVVARVAHSACRF